MDSLDVDQWLRILQIQNELTEEHFQAIRVVFGFMADPTDSALRIIVPLLQAYCKGDDQYLGTQKYIEWKITEDNQIKFVINIKIAYLDLQMQ